MRIPALVLLSLLLAFPAMAQTIHPPAVSHRALWPHSLASPQDYDRASRAEILVFAALLAQKFQGKPQGIKAALRERLLGILTGNFRVAQRSCTAQEVFCPEVDGVASLITASRQLAASLPEPYRPWHRDSVLFYQHYAQELLRLAALFPGTSSEIAHFSPAERDGFELSDSHFLLTFDDGPTAAGGTTDALLAILAQHQLHSLFFVLGERLEARQEKQSLYHGQCVALHGWHHVSHQKLEKWQDSVLKTEAQVKQDFADRYRPYFRPPYGQRTQNSAALLALQGITVDLWNIDSQDWNPHLTAEDAASRTLSLMLLWRRGILLFHDIHTKAQTAVPWLIDQTRNAGITWEDCRSY